MASEVDNSYDRAAIIAGIDTRRAAVLGSINQVDARMADKQFCADRISYYEKRIYCFLFEQGHNDPELKLGADYVAWLVDRQLWKRSEKLLGKPFPFNNRRPDSAYGPASGKLENYKRARLAKEAAEKSSQSPKPNNVQSGQEVQQPQAGPVHVGGQSHADAAMDMRGEDVEHSSRRLELKGKTTAADLHQVAKKIRRHTGVDTDNDDDDKRVYVGQPTAIVAPGAQTEQDEASNAPEHESSPVCAGTKRKRAATVSDTETELPEGGNRAADVQRMRLMLLCTKDMPDDSREWPKIIWEAMHEGKPSEHGEYFALPIRDDWLPLVSPEVLVRLNQKIKAHFRIRVAVREPAGAGKPRLLAVSFTKFRDPNVDQDDILIFGIFWTKVRQWHKHMVEGLPSYPLDQFMWTRAIYDFAGCFDME